MTSLLHLPNLLLKLPPHHLHNLNINIVPVTFVVEWVISRLNAENTTATTAMLC